MYKQLPQKDIQNLEKQERKKQPSGYKLASFPGHSQILSRSREIWEWPGNKASYKQCYTYQNQSLEVSKYMNSALVTCNKLDPWG